MKLTENPIFITHRRIVRRGGVAATTAIAALVGMGLLLGVIGDAPRGQETKDMALACYGWIVGLEIVVMVLGGCSRVASALVEDRKAGLWDSNRLTPLRPAEIVAGYWFGPPLREFYMGMVLAGFGLPITLFGGLPVKLWIGTQILLGGTTVFFWLLGVLTGIAFKRSQGVVFILLPLLALPFSFIAPSRLLTNFLVPIYGIVHLFQAGDSSSRVSEPDFGGNPDLFGLAIHPVLLSLGLQFILGWFVWRVLKRKTANPFQPMLMRGEAVALFGFIVLAQQTLLWSLWAGNFPARNGLAGHIGPGADPEFVLALVHGGIMFIGVILLQLASPEPEHVRIEALRLGFKSAGAVFSRSAASLALVLAGIASLGLLTHFIFALAASWRILLVMAVNLTEIFLVFVLLLEYCRLRHGRRAPGFFTAWLFLLGVIPFILAWALSSEEMARCSLLAPGFFAIALGVNASSSDLGWPGLFCTLGVHLVIVVVLAFAWHRQWRRFLEKAA